MVIWGGSWCLTPNGSSWSSRPECECRCRRHRCRRHDPLCLSNRTRELEGWRVSVSKVSAANPNRPPPPPISTPCCPPPVSLCSHRSGWGHPLWPPSYFFTSLFSKKNGRFCVIPCCRPVPSRRWRKRRRAHSSHLLTAFPEKCSEYPAGGLERVQDLTIFLFFYFFILGERIKMRKWSR